MKDQFLQNCELGAILLKFSINEQKCETLLFLSNILSREFHKCIASQTYFDFILVELCVRVINQLF